MVSKVPINMLVSEIVRAIGDTSKGGSLTHMFGVWAQKLKLADLTRK